jgi:hypothetical protein
MAGGSIPGSRVPTSSGSELLTREMRRLHALEYQRMIDAGAFDEDERVA